MKQLRFSTKILISVALVALAGVICFAMFDMPLARFDAVESEADTVEVEITATQTQEQGESAADGNTRSNTAQTKFSGVVNINTAGVDELIKLNGIGETKAQAIIDYRNENGAFSSIDEITNVKGIGEKIFEKIKDNITV